MKQKKTFKELKEDAGTTTTASSTPSTVDANVAKYSPNMGTARRDNLMGHAVFSVSNKSFNKSRFAKSRYHSYAKYIEDEDNDAREEIRDYAKNNPSKSIILKDKETGLHTFLKMGRNQREK